MHPQNVPCDVSKRVSFRTGTGPCKNKACAVPFCCPIMDGMKYGYARVSTDDQSPALDALKRAGCKTIFKGEGLSGATAKRPALLHCLKTLKPGDTLTVWKLDRLGRSCAT